MGKRILSLFLAALMVVSLMPTVAFAATAATHDLSVTKIVDTVETPATEGEDYAWDTTDSNKLIIKANGLTVSGSTAKEYIEVASGVTGLTINDLSITSETYYPILFNASGDATLTLVGSSSLTSDGYGYAILFNECNGTIAGTGSVTASSLGGAGIKGAALTFNQTGTVTASSMLEAGIMGTTLTFNNGIGRILARGEGYTTYGAVYGAVTLGNALTMKGSAAADTEEANINGETTIDENTVKTDGQIALSVLIEGAASTVTAQVQGDHGTAEVKDSEGNPITEAAKDTELTFTATPNTGYKFDHWEVVSGGVNIEATKTNNPITVTMPGEALTLKACYAPITYTVMFDNNGGSGNPNYQTMTYDVAAKLNPNKFTAPDGHQFAGWSTSNTSRTPEYGDCHTVMNLADTQDAKVTLYAIWLESDRKVATYVIDDEYYDGGDLSNTIEVWDPSGTFWPKGSTATANEGYFFKGWKDAEGNFITESKMYYFDLCDDGKTIKPVLNPNQYDPYDPHVEYRSYFAAVFRPLVTVSGVSMNKTDFAYGDAVGYTGTPVAKTIEGVDVTESIEDWVYFYCQNNGTADEPQWAELINAPTALGSYKLVVKAYDKENDYQGKLELPFTISKRAVTVSGIAVQDKTYNGKTDDAVIVLDNVSFTGKLAADNLTISGITGTYASANASDTQTVNLNASSAWTLGGASAANYMLATEGQPTSVTGKISKVTPTLASVSATAITYGQTLADSTVTGTATNENKTSDKTVEGTFAFTTGDTTPAVSDSENTTYGVTFTPTDGTNYNTSTTEIKLKVNKADYAEVIKTASGNLKAKKDSTAEITLPSKPINTSYGAVTNNNTVLYTINETNKASGKLTLTAAKDFDKTTESGDTTFTVAVEPDGNHNGYDITVTVTPTFIVSIIAEADGFTYGDNGKTGYKNVTVQDSLVDVNTLAATYYLADGTTKTTTANSGAASDGAVPVKQGSYKVVLSVPASNESYTGSKTVEFTVAQKEIGLEWNNTELTYNGENQKPTATATNVVSGDTVTVTVSGEQKDAGEGYTATASITNANYKLPTVYTKTFKISPKSLTNDMLNLDPTEKEYTGGEFLPTITVKDGGKTLEKGTDYTINDESKKIDANNYSVTVNGTANYTGSATKSWSITKANMSVSAPENEVVYNGEPHSATINVTKPAEGAAITYKTNPDADYTPDAPSFTDIGTYMVYFKVTNGNFNDYTGSATVKITPAPITPEVSIEGWTYGEEANEPETTGNPGEGNVAYTYKVKTADDSTYSGEVPTNAGDYTVKANVEANGNYQAGVATKDFAIAKKSATVKAADTSVRTGSTAPEFKVEFTDLLDADKTAVTEGFSPVFKLMTTGEAPEEISVEDALKTPGEYTIVIANVADLDAFTNYSFTANTGKLTVIRRSSGSTPTVTVPVSGDSNSVKVEASVSGSTATVKQIKDADLAKVTEGESVAIDLSGVGKNVDTAKIPTQTVEKIAEKSAMTVKLPVATVEFDKAATEEIADQAKGSNIELVVDDIKEVSLNAVQKETVKKLDTAIIIDAHLASNGSRLCTAENGGFGSGKANVILPYEIKNNRTAANYSVFYVDDAGKLQKLNAKYDEELAAFVFEIEHFSVYAVAYDEYVMPFVDVPETAYYYDAVKWAAANAITSGTDATHFNPLGITSRGQMVTFLWRAAGEPEPTATSCKFTDVKADAYYYKAVLWAVEKGITDGTSKTTFSPDMNVSRAQAVTFLARMSGVKDDAAGYTHKFADVKATAYYNNAVAWAYENKITDGTSETTFSPNDDCLRNQIVCFLYRYFVK